MVFLEGSRNRKRSSYKITGKNVKNSDGKNVDNIDKVIPKFKTKFFMLIMLY